MSDNATDQLDAEDDQDSYWLPVVVAEAILVLTVSTATVTLNAALLCLLLQKRFSTTPEAIIFGSMAVSDLMVGIFGPLHLIFETEVLKSRPLCFSLVALISLACSASTYHLLLISVEKYIVLFFPLHYHRVITNRKVSSCVVGVWVISVFSPSVLSPVSGSCISGDVFTLPVLAASCVVTLFVLAIMSYTYVRIFLLSRRHRRQIAATYPQQQQQQQDTTVSFPGSTTHGLRAGMKAALFSVVLCACVTLLWLPLLVEAMYSFFTGVLPDRKVKVFVIELFFSNSLANPVMYGLWHGDVRRQVKKQLQKLCCTRLTSRASSATTFPPCRDAPRAQ